MLTEGEDRVDRAFADPRTADFDAAHPALRRERNEFGADLGDLAAANAIFLLGQHHDRTAFRGFVGERSELRSIRQFLFGHAAHRLELSGLAVSERDGAGLVEQQGINVARGLHGAARHGEHIKANKTIHAGDADR